MKTREPGYYWVKHYGEWLIADYVRRGVDRFAWYFFGDELYVMEEELDEIDERRITRPE